MKISAAKIKSVYASVQDISEVLNENETLNYSFFPFTVILGNINTTETGYKDNYSIPNDYFSFSKVFTGEEAILAVWDDSYNLTPSANIINKVKGNVDNAKNFYYTKVFQVGHTFQGIWKNDSLSLDITASAQNSGFTSEQVVKQVSLIVKNDDTNAKFISQITNNIFKLYALPEINKLTNDLPPTGTNQLNNEKRNPYSIRYDRQWYYISNIIKTHNSTNKEVAFCEVEFTSLNDKLAHTGLAVNQYIQPSAPGEPFAYPTFDATDDTKIILDDAFLSPLPVTHAQVTFYGSAGVNNITFMGREVLTSDIKPAKNMRIGTPGLLFPYIYQAPVYDNLSLKAVATNSYYMVAAEPVIDTYFKNWVDNIAGTQLFDESNQKVFEGHIRSIKTESRATNNASGKGAHHVPYWDDNFMGGGNSILTHKASFNVGNNPYFIYQHASGLKIGDSTTLNYGDSIGFNNFNMLNYFTAFQTYQVPLNVRETTPVTLNSLPIVGGFLNKLFAGIPVGFKTAVGSLPNNHTFLILWSCGIYDNYSDVLYAENNERKESIIPYNAFDNANNKINAMIGSQAQTTSFAFSLTNMIASEKWDNKGNKLSSPQQIETYNLSTLSSETLGDFIYLLYKDSVLYQKSNDVFGYYIDAFSFQSYFKGNYKVEFFSNPYGKDQAIDEKNAVWVGTYTTFAALTNNIRLWTELKQLSNPTYDFNAQIAPYPEAIQTPDPAEADIYTKLTTYLSDTDLPATENNSFKGDIKTNNEKQENFNFNSIPSPTTIKMTIPEPREGFEFSHISDVRMIRRAKDIGIKLEYTMKTTSGSPQLSASGSTYLNTYSQPNGTEQSYSIIQETLYITEPNLPTDTIGSVEFTAIINFNITGYNANSVFVEYTMPVETVTRVGDRPLTYNSFEWVFSTDGTPAVEFEYLVTYKKTSPK